jgi:uncharacterized membrane protein YccC
MDRPGFVTRDQVFLAANTAIAAGLAWVAALAADPHSRPYFAPLAVLLVVQPTVYDSLSRAFQRVAGVVVGVAAALAVSRVLAPSGWSIGIIIFVGLLAGWTARLGPQGVVEVPVSALLVFLVGQTTPGYAGERIVDTLIGAGFAVIAVLLTPSAPAPDAVLSQALAPLHRCAEVLRAVSAGIASTWTAGQADAWRQDAVALIDSIATARRDQEAFRLSARWNARAGRQRAALGQAEEALRSGERIAVCTRSMARPWRTDRAMPARCRLSAHCWLARRRPPQPTPRGWPPPVRPLTAGVWPRRSGLRTTPSPGRSAGPRSAGAATPLSGSPSG